MLGDWLTCAVFTGSFTVQFQSSDPVRQFSEVDCRENTPQFKCSHTTFQNLHQRIYKDDEVEIAVRIVIEWMCHRESHTYYIIKVVVRRKLQTDCAITNQSKLRTIISHRVACVVQITEMFGLILRKFRICKTFVKINLIVI